jgi:hypothetical protein
MSKTDKKSKRENEPEIMSPKAKPKKAKKASIVAESEAPEAAAGSFDFTGRVEKINIRLEGPGKPVCDLTLRSKSGDRKSYSLDPSDAQRFTAMLSLLTSASGIGAMISARSAPREMGLDDIAEIELRSKSRKLKVK